MTTNPTRVAPTSPQGRPTPGGDPHQQGSPLAPYPGGGDPCRGRQTHPPQNPKVAPRHRGDHNPWPPGAIWLITTRTHPAWTATLDLLDDNHWPPLTDLADTMRATAGLAPTTIRRNLKAASQRQWIQQSRGRVRLRDRQAIEDALDLLECGR